MLETILPLSGYNRLREQPEVFPSSSSVGIKAQIPTPLLPQVVMSKEASDFIDRNGGALTGLSPDNERTLSESNVPAFFEREPRALQALLIPIPKNVGYQEVDRSFYNLGFDIGVGKIGWPTGYGSANGLRFFAEYRQLGGNPVLRIQFTTPGEISTKVAVINIMARHMHLLGERAEPKSIIKIKSEKSFTRNSLEEELKNSEWAKTYFIPKYFHPMDKPVAYIHLSSENNAHEIPLELLPHATKDDEIQYKRNLKRILKKITNP